MEEDIQKYSTSVVFRGTPCSQVLAPPPLGPLNFLLYLISSSIKTKNLNVEKPLKT